MNDLNFVAQVNSKDLLEDFSEFVSEQKKEGKVLIGTKDLSRFGTFESTDLLLMTKLSREKKLSPILVWDVLQTENRFSKNKEIFEKIKLDEFDAIRVQDPGVLEYILETNKWIKIELILETGNHNLEAISKWIEYCGDRLQTVVLSLELPNAKLKEMISTLQEKFKNINFELMVFGPILLFYTPRPLLSALKPETQKINGALFASGTSEESPHSGFPLIENLHGTFMFNTKDHSLISEIGVLRDVGISQLRFDIDLLNHKREKVFTSFFKNIELEKISDDDIKKIKDLNPRPLIKGFFQVNKSDVLFTRLKNRKIERKDDNFLGEIIDVERDQHLCLWVKSNQEMNLPIKVKIITPEGKEKTLELNSVKSLELKIEEKLVPMEYFLISFVSGVSVKSKVYKVE